MNYSELTEIAIKIAQRAGDMIRERRESGVEVAATKSTLTDIVTEADLAAEVMIVENLKTARPEDSIVGEEGTSHNGSTEFTWVIDPIDGTVNYLYDLPAYCVSIAATIQDKNAFEDGRRPVAAAVYNPKTGEMFSASEGFGAYLNGERIFASKETEITQALIATGFGYSAERRREQHEILGRVIADIRDIRRIGTAAYDLCLVASGRLEGYFEKGIKPWDWAAGALIASEAGAIFAGKNGNALPGEEFMVAAAPGVAQDLISRLQKTD